jgi:hypothetical protein
MLPLPPDPFGAWHHARRWTLDRGSGYYQKERSTKKKASLLGSGK